MVKKKIGKREASKVAKNFIVYLGVEQFFDECGGWQYRGGKLGAPEFADAGYLDQYDDESRDLIVEFACIHALRIVKFLDNKRRKVKP